MDEVFKALADPTRRSLLDELFREDGQSLARLRARFEHDPVRGHEAPEHPRGGGPGGHPKCGREKLHFLNPVPIRLVHDRWVSKYAEPWAAGLSELKSRLERPMEKIFEIYIKTTPERLWEAITDPEIRSKYHFGTRVESDWTAGARRIVNANGRPTLAGRRRDPGGRPAPPAGSHHAGAVGR